MAPGREGVAYEVLFEWEGIASSLLCVGSGAGRWLGSKIEAVTLTAIGVVQVYTSMSSGRPASNRVRQVTPQIFQ
jgi:hypothetical protein